MPESSDTVRILDALAIEDARSARRPSTVPAAARFGIRAFASLVTAYVAVVLATATSTFAIIGLQPSEPGLSVAVGGYLAILGAVFAAVR